MAWVTNFLDGFDHYATADVGAKWDNADMGITIDSTTFRTSGQSLRASGGALNQLSKRLNVAARNVVFGFGLRVTTAPSGTGFSTTGAFALLSNEQGAGSTTQLCFALFSDGKLHVGRCTSSALNNVQGTDLGGGTTVFSSNTWYYVEIRAYIHDTLGAVEVRVNGVVDQLLTGIDTKNHATLDVAEYLHIRAHTNQATYWDDLYVRTESSSSEVTGGFLGDIKIKPYYPNADGTYTAMTCSTGTTHNTLVDEATPNTTDYVSSSTALQKDSYGFQDASETGSIKAVQLNAYCYKIDSGFRGVDVFVKSGATEQFATSKPLSTTQKYALKVWEQDPNTSADWSQTNLNAAEFGVRISADL